MPYAHKVARITMSGTSFEGNEIWSTGFFMGHEGQDADIPSEEFLGHVNTHWQTFWTNNAHFVGNKWKTDTIRGALLGTDGKTIPDSINHHYVTTPYQGGGSGTQLPPQCSLVATMFSSEARGLAAKGRMYLPGIVAPIGDNGKLTTNVPPAIALGLVTFFEAVALEWNGGGKVILASKGRTKPTQGPGVNREVIGVKVGDVYDTQRRRRNALIETYSQALLTP